MKKDKLSNNKIQTGRVIVFDGASSAGKSSVIKKLKLLLDDSYEYVAIDDFVSDVFLEQQKLNLPEREFLDRVNQRSDAMYDKINDLVHCGKNVILDTVLSGLEGEKSIKEQLEKLDKFNTIKILVHCPLPVLVNRIKQRNLKAEHENKPDEERSIGTAVNQFGHIYKEATTGSSQMLGSLTRAEVDMACEATKQEFGTNIYRFNQFKNWLLTQLGVDHKTSVTLSTRLKYDLIVNTNKNTSEECARKINLLLGSKIIAAENGIHLYTESFGAQNNPAILLISGAMAPARFWTDEFCKQFTDSGYFVIRYDHRDMGLSSAVDYSARPYNLNDLAKDAISVLDAYNIKNAHVIGHSMGGGIAQIIALDYPASVKSLTLISSSVLANPEMNLQEKSDLEKTWQEMMKNKPTKNYETSVDGFLKSFEYLHGTIPMDKDIAQQYVKDMYERTLPLHLEWFEKFSAGLEPLHNHVKAQQNQPDRINELKQIKIPVLVIHGEKDCLAFQRIIKEYCADLIPNSKIEIIPGMGHMILNKDLFEKIGKIILGNIKS